jgi:hypothetical protein
MSIDNENYQEEELDEQIEIVDDSEQDETTVATEQPVKDWEAETKKLQAILDRKNRQAEKRNSQPLTTNKSNSVEETVLRAQGVEDGDIAHLKKVAAILGTSLIEARKDELFTIWKEGEERKLASQRAMLGASKGAGSKSREITFNTPGLTAEQHKELWKQRQGK